MIYQKLIKPSFDFITALIMLIILLPVFLIIVVSLALTQNNKIFFIQKRPGLNEKPFYLIKFKTMNDKVNSKGELLPDMERMLKTGRFLRKTSLDELPQLINVLKGDMSFVGPRPLLMEYLPLYNAMQRRRHSVKPGITGWAQVNGRNALSWKEKFELDIFYVEKQSFILDLKILFITASGLFQTKNVNAGKEETMPIFTGND
jgi:undecaprenyl phosphate N,N'-diacetylbacillosamine 1-phosphate transferase